MQTDWSTYVPDFTLSPEAIIKITDETSTQELAAIERRVQELLEDGMVLNAHYQPDGEYVSNGSMMKWVSYAPLGKIVLTAKHPELYQRPIKSITVTYSLESK